MIIDGYDDQSDCGILTRLFSSKAVAQILDFFLDHKEFDYSANEISQKTGLSFRTVFREIPDLERIQVIYNSRRIGKTNMYKLNADFNAVLLLEKFVLELSQLRPYVESQVDSDHLTNQGNTQSANTMI
ncbi:MAG TPA: winged helix-turn-helix domain-containing protein [Nitrososphaeraceae archaeon]